MDLFELLNEFDLSETKFSETIFSWDTDDFNFFYESINLVINESSSSNDKSGVNFVANNDFSGGGFTCSELECRSRNLDILARNSLLYADKVYLQNWFERHSAFEKIVDPNRFDLANSIGLLYQIKPLLINGYFEFCANEHHFCTNCLNELLSNGLHDFDHKSEDAIKILNKKFLKSGEFILKKNYDGKPAVFINAPTSILEHDMVMSFNHYIPDVLRKIYKPKKEIRLKKDEIRESGLANYFSYQIVDDLQNQSYYASLLNTRYLTSREVDFEILSKLNEKENKSKSNLIYNNLSHSVPQINEASYKDLIRLRKEEGEAFQVYRDSLNKLLDDFKETEPDKIKQALADVIKPELHKIEKKISDSKKLLFKDLGKDIVVGSLFVGVSMFSGIIPPNLAEVVYSLGGIQYVNQLSSKISDNMKNMKDVKENEFYFLWKLKK